MASIVCPMCSRHIPLESFQTNKSGDIEMVLVRGLGRGRGFEIAGRSSLFHSKKGEEIISAIRDRAFEIVKVLRDNGIASDFEIWEGIEFGDDFLPYEDLIKRLVSRID